MKVLHCIIIVAAMTCVWPAKAQNAPDQRPGTAPPAAVGGPLMPLYIVSGVRSSGADNTGPATSFVCTTFSGATETVKVQLWNSLGTVVIDQNVAVNSLATQTFSTNATQLFSELLLGAPLINPPGFALIYATSSSVVCTAMLLDAANVVPQGIALHQQRFNAIPGTQE